MFDDFIPQERKPAVNEMRRPGQGRPFKGKEPSMQFFGPSDFVPELPHNVQVAFASSKDWIVFTHCAKQSMTNQSLVCRVGWSDCRAGAGELRAVEAC